MDYDSYRNLMDYDGLKAEVERLKDDPVNCPSHYNKHNIECVQAIEASMSDEEFQGYLKGNVIKYLWRYKYKGNPVQDLGKAQYYLKKLLEKSETSL